MPNPSIAKAKSAPRGERRKRETRARLLKAALSLMAQRGMHGVAINEITEAADVGFGSFYNHFDSKEAIYDALVEEVLNRFGDALSHISEAVEDPAEILAASIRYVASRARQDPVWGRFLLRTGFSMQSLSDGMGQYLLLDLRRGLASGRFQCDDLVTTLFCIGGAAMGAINVELELGENRSSGRRVAKKLGVELEGVPERAAAAVLHILGLPADEADEIARRPLPHVDLPS